MSSDPYLLTPGPLTTSLTTKEAMLHDWGSWDSAFHEITNQVRQYLINLIDGQDEMVCVPMQGSGTFAVESAIGTLVPPTGKVLIPNNGAYCQRIIKICKVLGRPYIELPVPEQQAASAEQIDTILANDSSISHVALVHCETSSGILNPLAEIAQVVAKAGRELIVDAMSTFGALPISVQDIPFTALIASGNKCLEGVPGFAFVLVKRKALETSEGNAHSLSLDLYDQWTYMEKTRQWRYTPPTHCVAALLQAIEEHIEEGGCRGRLARYEHNYTTLLEGMERIGFKALLPARVRSPIIVTFYNPPDPNFDFIRFYNALRDENFIIYPGKLTVADTFRIGCIGRITAVQITVLLHRIKAIIEKMQIKTLAPEKTVAEPG